MAMASFLKQQSWSLKQSSLEALVTIVTYHGSEDPSLDDGTIFATVLAEVANRITDSDLHISDLSFLPCGRCCCQRTCVDTGIGTVDVPSAPRRSVAYIQASLLLSKIFEGEERFGDLITDYAGIVLLTSDRANLEEKLSKHALSSLAQGIAVITAATAPENQQGVVSNILSSLEATEDATDDAAIRQMVLSLRVSGDLGRLVDF